MTYTPYFGRVIKIGLINSIISADPSTKHGRNSLQFEIVIWGFEKCKCISEYTYRTFLTKETMTT